MISVFESETVQEALNDSGIFVSDIERKVDKEVLQTINCLYNLSLPTRVAKLHEHSESTSTFLQLDWNLCEKVLPSFMPDKLPVLSEREKVSAELIELLQRFRKLIELPLTDELRSEFEKFMEEHKDFRWVINIVCL